MTDKAFDALHRSIKRADLAAIRNALNEGISANLENRFGWTMLMLAASEGDTAMGEYWFQTARIRIGRPIRARRLCHSLLVAAM